MLEARIPPNARGPDKAPGAGASFAGYVLLTRRLSHAAPPLVTLSITSLVGLVVTSAMLPAVWVTPRVASGVYISLRERVRRGT